MTANHILFLITYMCNTKIQLCWITLAKSSLCEQSLALYEGFRRRGANGNWCVPLFHRWVTCLAFGLGPVATSRCGGNMKGSWSATMNRYVTP
jgi:hypothetical protein